jgi:uncharacterized membrane protein
VRARPRLFISIAVGVVLTAAAVGLTDWRPTTRLIAGWDLAVALYLALALHLMASSDVRRIRRHAAAQDEGQLTILACTVAAAVASLAAIFAELRSSAGGGRPASSVLLAALTIFLSWVFIHTIFALHYAHEFYDDTGGRGMAFPGGELNPDYWDFVYFSFVIGMTFQVSDVQVTSKLVRRVVVAHGAVSFFYNVAVLAMMVNIGGEFIK